MTNQLTPIEAFNQGFASDRNQAALKKYFGNQKLLDRFTAVTVRAVQENPDLLLADRKSLFYACGKAAQDNLVPDGKEGFLAIYKCNEGTRENPKWLKKVEWQPMVLGLRKILANNNIHVRAEIVYEKDKFEYVMGDTPSITHELMRTGHRGGIEYAYAIATNMATGEKFHDLMDVAELEKVHQASKYPNSGAWKTWLTEMYRKAVVKRLFKQLPLPDAVLEIIDRDNEQFDMNKPEEVSSAAREVQEAVRLAASSENRSSFRVRLEAPSEEAKLETVIHQDREEVAVEAPVEDRPVDDPAEPTEQAPDF